MDSPPTPQALVPAWPAPFQANAAVTASPVVHDGKIYFGTYSGTLHCVDLATGSSDWSFAADGQITTPPTCAGSVVYFTSWDGFLYSIWTDGFTASGDPRAGQLRWKTYHAGIGGSSPLVVDNTVYVGVGSPSCEIRSYNVATGQQIDSALTRQPVQSSPTLAGAIIACGSNDGYMRSFSTSLEILHQRSTAGSFGYSSGIATPFGVVFTPGEEDHSLQIWDPETGQDVAVPYSTGTVSVTQGSNVVSGSGTNWNGLALAGGAFMVQGISAVYRVASVTSPTTLTLASNYAGVTNPAANYSIQYLLPYASGWRPVPTHPGSPAVSGNVIVVQQRHMSGSTNRFYVVAVDWDGTQLFNRWRYQVDFAAAVPVEPTAMCPSPAVSGNYVYAAFANQVNVFLISNPVEPPAGDPPLPAPQRVATFTTPNLPTGSVDTIHSSPAISNGRIVMVTYSGRVYCFMSDNSPPPTPNLIAPVGGVNVENNNPTITWQAVLDPDMNGVSYQIQVLSGSPNLDQYSAPIYDSATTSYTIAAPNNSHIYYRVRALDTLGAASAWSDVEHFWVFESPPAPAPPTDFHAYPGDQRIFMSWTASPSWTTVGYKVYYRFSTEAPNWPESQSWWFLVAPWVAGQMIERTGMPLQNYVSYDLMLFAQDGSGALSTGVYKAGVIPAPLITIGVTSYPTIQAALDAAEPGDTIVLGAGTFDTAAPLPIPDGVSLRGQGPDLTILRGTNNIATVLYLQPHDNNSTISMLGICGTDPATEGGAQCGITIEVSETGHAHVRVHNVIVFDINGNGIDVVRLGPDEPENPPHFDLLTILHNQGNGINVSYNGTVRVRNSIIARNGQWGIFDSNANPQTVDADYNDVFDNSSGDYSENIAVGENGISDDPQFVNEGEGDFRVEQGSPTIDKGDPETPFANEPQPNGGRVNMGAFGNTEWATQSFVYATVSSGSGGGGGGGGGICFIRGTFAAAKTDDSQHR
jgi:outer membrane protein assembly factor BamB